MFSFIAKPKGKGGIPVISTGTKGKGGLPVDCDGIGMGSSGVGGVVGGGGGNKPPTLKISQVMALRNVKKKFQKNALRRGRK
jgi:hypothetical protein